MTKLKLGAILDDKPVRVTIDIPGTLHRDLLVYAAILARETGQPPADPARLVAPMLAHFIANERGFRAQRAKAGTGQG